MRILTKRYNFATNTSTALSRCALRAERKELEMEKGWESAPKSAQESPREAIVMVEDPDSALGERGEAFGEGMETVRTPVPAEMLAQGVPVQVDGAPTEANNLPPTPGDPLRPPRAEVLDKLFAHGGVIGQIDGDLSGAVSNGAVVVPLDDGVGTSRMEDDKLAPARRRTLLFAETSPPSSPASSLQTVQLVVPNLPSPAASTPTVQVVLEVSWREFAGQLKALLDQVVPDGGWTITIHDGPEGWLMVKVNWQDLCLHALAKTSMWREGLRRFPEKLRPLVLLIWVDMQHHIGAGANYLCVRGWLPDHVVCEPIVPVQPVPVEQVEEPSWLSGWKLAAAVAFLVTSVASVVFFGLV